MYCEYYKLSSEPFQLAVQPPAIFAHENYSLARAGMQRALEYGSGTLMILGPVGSGKSVLVEGFVHELDANDFLVATLGDDPEDRNGLLVRVCCAFGLRAIAKDKGGLLDGLEAFLLKSPRAVLVIDDADILTEADFQDLRLLNYLRGSSRALLQIYLIGSAGLYDLVRDHGVARLYRAGIPVYALGSLSLQETREYVVHRLNLAGWDGSPDIPAESFRLIHQATEGIPAAIDALCTHVLLRGAENERCVLDADDVDSVIRTLPESEWKAVARRSPAVEPGILREVPHPTAVRASDTDATVAAGEAAPVEQRHPSLKLVSDRGESGAQERPDASQPGSWYQSQEESDAHVDSPASDVGHGPFEVVEPSAEEAGQVELFDQPDTPEKTEPVDQVDAPEADRQADSANSPNHQEPQHPSAEEENHAARRTSVIVGIAAVALASAFGLYRWALSGQESGREVSIAPAAVVQDMQADSEVSPPVADTQTPSRDGEFAGRDQQVPDAAVSTSAEESLLQVSRVLVDGDADDVALPADASANVPAGYAENIDASERSRELNAIYARHVERREIEQLLSLAERAFRRDRLRTPVEISAWHYYQQVFELEPDNVDAEEGKRRIAERYGEIAYGEIDLKDYEGALTYINRGLELVPDDATLLTLQKRVADLQAR